MEGFFDGCQFDFDVDDHLCLYGSIKTTGAYLYYETLQEMLMAKAVKLSGRSFGNSPAEQINEEPSAKIELAKECRENINNFQHKLITLLIRQLFEDLKPSSASPGRDEVSDETLGKLWSILTGSESEQEEFPVINESEAENLKSYFMGFPVEPNFDKSLEKEWNGIVEKTLKCK